MQTELSTVVSEMGEHWSPYTLPSMTAAKHSVMNNSGCAKPCEPATAQASGMASGNATAYVPQLVPVENAIVSVMTCSNTGSRKYGMLSPSCSTRKMPPPVSLLMPPMVIANSRMTEPSTTPLSPS